MSIKSPSWKITNMEDCKKILSKGVADGMTDVIWERKKDTKWLKMIFHPTPRDDGF